MAPTNPSEPGPSQLERATTGNLHKASVKHAHRYASQFEFLANSRTLSDGARFETLVKRTVGKRLTYAEQVGA